MTRWIRVFVVGALALSAAAAGVQTAYPGKPIRLIVPVPVGGPSDAAARAVAKGMTAGQGQEVLVDNRPGGDTGIGAGAVLNANADGYTLLFALASNAAAR
jgi:tripartite-type tricarboxylate transporter receptor subunit TctC